MSKDGSIKATAGEIGGWKIGANSLSADNGNAIINAAVPYLGLGGADSFGQDGIWLGKDIDGTYKFYIGNDTQHMYWNGERLVMTGVFVGAIAHQIANTRLLCHFDNTTMGSLGQAATSITGSVSYPTGKFGKAISTASGYPSYSPSLFSSAQGTIMAWVKFNTVNNGTNHRLHTVAGAGSTYVMVYEYGGHLIFMAGTNGVDTGYNLVAGQWYHIAFTYDQTTFSTRMYVNGANVYSGSSYAFGGSPTAYAIGGYSSSGNNLLIDDYLHLDRVMDEYEILSIYASNASIIDSQENYTFVSPTGLAWMDENGIFAPDGSGNAVLGVITQDRIWGGQSLCAGRCLIGNGTSYMKWDKTTGSLIVAGEINAISGTISGTLSVGASGGLSAGGGDVVLNSSGITVLAGTGDINKLKWSSSSGRRLPPDVSMDEWLHFSEGVFSTGGTSLQRIKLYANAGIPISLELKGNKTVTSDLSLYINSALKLWIDGSTGAHLGDELTVGSTSIHASPGDLITTGNVRVRGGTLYFGTA